MGPVWEVNHIWIIILIVILWIAFPEYYNIMVVYYHIPLTLVLLGVTLRGVAFVFRHYDAVIDNSQYIYDAMFKFSSLITPIFLGMVFGGLISGMIPLDSAIGSLTFFEAFVRPWCNGFSILVGLFFAALCAFLSSVLLIGEAPKEHYQVYIKKAARSTIVVVIIGLLTFGYGYSTDMVFVHIFLKNTYALTAMLVSGFLLIPLWITINQGRRVFSRFFAGLQVFLILLAALAAHFPNIIISKHKTISILENSAPDSVIQVLGITLIIGGAVILPGVFHLLKTFKMIKILDRNNASI